MAASPILAWPLPASSDAPDAPAQLLALATAAEKYAVMRFASATARDAAIPAPVNGMYCVTTNNGVEWRRNGTTWVVNNIPVFATTAARDAAIPAPTAGIKAVIGSGSSMVEYTHTGSGWALTREDTGWVTTGLTLAPGTNWAVDAYRLRRMNGRVSGIVVATYTGAPISVLATGIVSTSSSTIATLPAGWGDGSLMPHTVPLNALEASPTSLRQWATRILGTSLQLINGVPGQSLATGAQLRCFVDHYAS